MIAAIYARKSTDQTGVVDDQRSVARQVEHGRAYAESKGWTVGEGQAYVDDGISGAEFANRPAFLRMMNALKPRPPFDVLIMSEESRLGREQIETSFALKQLVQAGVRVFFYMEDRERKLDSPTDKIMLSLATFADELEREKARQRTADAMMRKAKAGHVCGGLCYGYKNVEVAGPDGRRAHVRREIIPEEAAVVREIFRRCASGWGKTRITKYLNAQHAPAPRAAAGRPRAWSPSTVRAVLYRDSYRGVVIWNKTRKRDSWGRRAVRARPESEWLEVPVPDLRIVSDEEWTAAHDRLTRTRANYLRTTRGKLWGRPVDGRASKYLLIGLARCGQCGDSLEMRSRATTGGRRLVFYSCRGHYRRGTCPNKIEIPMPIADKAVLDAVLAEILTPVRLAEVARRAVEQARAERAAQPDLREQLGRDLRKAERALARLTGVVAAGADDVPAVVDAIKAEETRRRTLAARIEALDSPAPTINGKLEARLTGAVEEWRAILGRQVPVARQILSKLLAEKLAFTPEDRNGRRGFRFQGAGTVERLVGGALPGVFPGVVPPTGFEPVFPP